MLYSPEVGEVRGVVGSPSPPVLPCGPYGWDESGVQSSSGEYTHLGPPGTVLAMGKAGRGGRDRETELFVSQGSVYPSHRVNSLGQRSPQCTNIGPTEIPETAAGLWASRKRSVACLGQLQTQTMQSIQAKARKPGSVLAHPSLPPRGILPRSWRRERLRATSTLPDNCGYSQQE